MNPYEQIGKRFGRLVIVDYAGEKVFGIKQKKKYRIFKCKCDCGNEKEIMWNALKNNHTQSCGCLVKDIGKERMKTHGMTDSPLYNSWFNMKRRCTAKNIKAYKMYGGIGITYNSKWETFEGFLDDLYEEFIRCQEIFPGEKLTLERLDFNKNYNKENCTFVPRSVQLVNTRATKRRFLAISPTGEEVITCNQNEFARNNNLRPNDISRCLTNKIVEYKGWKFYWVDEKL